MDNLPAFWVVIPAAGIGSRMRADRPKQYLQVAGRTILEHSLSGFLDHPHLRGLVLALAADDPWWPTLACAADARIQRVRGGAERADSLAGACGARGENPAGAETGNAGHVASDAGDY